MVRIHLNFDAYRECTWTHLLEWKYWLAAIWTIRQISVKYEPKYKTFHLWKCIWICRLRNGGHLVQRKWVKIPPDLDESRPLEFMLSYGSQNVITSDRLWDACSYRVFWWPGTGYPVTCKHNVGKKVEHTARNSHPIPASELWGVYWAYLGKVALYRDCTGTRKTLEARGRVYRPHNLRFEANSLWSLVQTEMKTAIVEMPNITFGWHFKSK